MLPFKWQPLEAGTDPEPYLHHVVAEYAAGRGSWNEVLAFINQLVEDAREGDRDAV